MSLVCILIRLRAAVGGNYLPNPNGKVVVDRDDLETLLREFDRTYNHLQSVLAMGPDATVRDEFAMAALKAMGQPKGSQSVEDVARWAYQMADAMMQERAR